MSRLRRARLAWVGALLAIAIAAPARAHDQPYSWLELHLSPAGIEGRVTAHIVDLGHESGLVADSLLDRAYLERHTRVLRSALAARLDLVADDVPVRPEWGAPEPDPARKVVTLAWRAAWAHLPGMLRIEGPLFAYDPQHETYLNVYEGGTLVRQDLLTHEHTRYDHFTGGRQGLLAVLRTFLLAGIHHIFIGPDHILFVVGLLLLGGGARRLLKIITAFTVAHSITLALATLGIVTPPARIVEPAIALSIVVVGIGNLRARPGAPDARTWAALGFGFIHGFGFASVLREVGLPPQALGVSLFAFNAGVEVGQACIVLAVAPMLALLRIRAPRAAPRVVLAGSLVVAIAGACWFVERAFFPGR